MSFHFAHPAFLFLGLLALPLIWLGWRAMRLADPVRRFTALALRAVLLLVLVGALAGPQRLQTHDQLTVIGVLDISGSIQRFADLHDRRLKSDGAGASPAASMPASALVPASSSSTSAPAWRSNIEYLRQWFRIATRTKTPDDRFGLVIFDGQAAAVSAPTRSRYVDDNIDTPIVEGTDIAQAVRLATAMFPPDTARRLVLVTDGNETSGDVLEAIKRNAGENAETLKSRNAESAQERARTKNFGVSAFRRFGVSTPIDVLPIAYHVTGDVQVVRIEAPPAAQPGQTVTIRVMLESAAPTPGRLTLRREGVPVDLNGAAPGESLHIVVPAGDSVQVAQVPLGETPINRFDAVFEPDNPMDDALADNNRAEAFTATPSRGTVLVLDPHAAQRDNLLTQILADAGIPSSARQPAAFPEDLLALQNFDLVVLDNVPAADLSTAQKALLAKYVNDLGGGLIMIGGDNSFGAGGWSGTPVAEVLPLNLDPPKQLRLPTAAVVIVMDRSGSMRDPVAGARASKQKVANEAASLAIESLRKECLVGVVTFDTDPEVTVPLQPNEDPKKITDLVRGVTPDGGTNMGPALEAAFDMLRDAKVAKKRIVCMTDGKSMAPESLPAIAERLAAADIHLTTISIGDDADDELLEKLAQLGKGEFRAVRDPRVLSRILVDSVQVINKPLLKDISFTPRVLATGSSLASGMDAAPPLGGLVITSPRDDSTAVIEMVDPDGEPLLAHWQAGLGRVAAFTSDLQDAWGRNWIDWPEGAAFWTQLVRTTSRPPMSQDAELVASIQDDRLNLALEVTGPLAESRALEDLQVDGVVYQPDGSIAPVRLRQAAPGRYAASIDARLSGNYIVALNPRQGSKRLAPVIGGVSRSTSPEFRNYRSNLALLEEIVEETGGRRLSIDDPGAVDLFDRAGMPPSTSLLPFWRTILFWALLVLLLDVACRRIAWDWPMVRGAMANLVAKVRPASAKGREVAATLATLRGVSQEVDRRQEADAAGITKLHSDGRIMPPPDRTIRPFEPRSDSSSAASTVSARPGSAPAGGEHPAAAEERARAAREKSEADAKKVAAALDALLGRGGKKPDGAPSASQPPSSTDAASETTGSLLAAKRRAQRRISGGDGGSSEQA